MNFDARTAKALKPGEHIIISDYPGLRLSASAKVRTWIYRYKSTVDGRMRQAAIGHWPAMSFPAAIVAWEQLKSHRDKGGDPALESKQKRQDRQAAVEQRRVAAEKTAYTVRLLCDDYLEGHIKRHRAPKGAKEIERMFNTMLGATGDLPAVDVTRAVAFDLIQSFSGKAPVQAANLRSELGAAWDYALDAGRLPDSAANWWRLILRGKIRSRGKTIDGKNIGTAKRVLTDEEVGTLIKWLPNFSQRLEDVLTMYLWTGARGVEICAMMGSEVKDEGGQLWWTMPKAKTKNARHENATDQRVPLFGRALTIVTRQKQLYGDGYLFRPKASDKPIGQKTITEQVYCYQPYSKIRPERYPHRLPVTHWAPHDLRRTARTTLAKLGCPDTVGEMILGHMLTGVAGMYNLHKYDTEKREWLKRLSDHWESLVA